MLRVSNLYASVVGCCCCRQAACSLLLLILLLLMRGRWKGRGVECFCTLLQQLLLLPSSLLKQLFGLVFDSLPLLSLVLSFLLLLVVVVLQVCCFLGSLSLHAAHLL